MAIVLIVFVQNLHAQKSESKEFEYSNRISLVAGLIQPLVLKGGNLELTYFSKRMSYDYSHGFSLDMAGGTMVGDAKIQNLAYHLPFSTGFGIGYRFTSFFDVRIEPKIHSFQVYYDGVEQNKSNLIQHYFTYTLGVGAYYRYMPFRKSSTWLQGITTSTSVRWWPNIGSSLSNNEFTYHNKFTQKNETLAVSNIGFAGSPIIFNVSVGYCFGKSKN